MPADEKQAFDSRLEQDAEFADSFAEYKSNRDEIVKNELAEYDEPILDNTKNNLWKWMVAVISLLCLLFMIDFYWHKPYAHSAGNTSRQDTSFFDRFNVFKKINNRLNHKSHNAINSEHSETSEFLTSEQDSDFSSFQANSELNGNLTDSIDFEYLVSSDSLLQDSELVVHELRSFKERQYELANPNDTLVESDSLIWIKPPVKNARKINVHVEYWASPETYKGYRFNGKKLVLFGFRPTEPIFLLHTDEGLVLRTIGDETVLIRDDNFHEL